MQPDSFLHWQTQFTAQHQQFVMQQQRIAAAQESKLDRLFGMMEQIQKDVAELKEANRSSSSSSGRVPCPLHCGTDFKKVQSNLYL
jgi:hypothetical protein